MVRSWLRRRPGGLFGNQGVRIVRYTQSNGVASVPSQVFSAAGGPATAMTGVGNLVAVAIGLNTGSQIKILQAGAGGTLTELGSVSFTYPPGLWWHDAHTVAMRAVPGQPNSYQLIFNVGSQDNQFPSTGTVDIAGLTSQTLKSNSIYSLTLTVNGSSVTSSTPTQVASGLRNAFALGFNAAGDIYFGENGIDFNGNIPLSSDYFGIIPAGTAGVLNFGFPGTYYDAITGVQVGPSSGVTTPYVKFLPINGMSSQGVGGIAVTPAGPSSA